MTEYARIVAHLPKQSCPVCGGSGMVADPRVIGAAMKKKRIEADVSLREVARRMSFTPAYVSDLEHGRRGWKACLAEQYLYALKESQ